MHHLNLRWAAATLVAAAGILTASVASGSGGQPSQAGGTATCTTHVVTTTSSGGGGQSNSSSVDQVADGGGDATCDSTISQTNVHDSTTTGSTSVTHVHGTGSAPLAGKLTVRMARRHAKRIAAAVDPAATAAKPACRQTKRGARCTITSSHAKLRIDFRRSADRLTWRYRGTRTR
jgi:hypothetical protein